MYPPLPRSEIELPGGRALSYAEFGRPNGTPLFLFHGTPGSRLIGRVGHNAAADRDIRLIVPDRPGSGRSDFQRGRTILGWVEDVKVLASALGVERFAVAGISGGGPYALACGLKIPERLTGLGVVSGVAPIRRATTRGMSVVNRSQLSLARKAPPLFRLEWSLLSLVAQRYPERLMASALRSMPPADREVYERDEVASTLVADMTEATARGARGVAQEMTLMARPWGFRLEDVTMPVHLWQGEADRNVPLVMGKYQAKTLSNCTATFIPKAGHFWFVDNLDTVFAAITDQ